MYYYRTAKADTVCSVRFCCSFISEIALCMIETTQLNLPVTCAYSKGWLSIGSRAIDNTAITHTVAGTVPGARHYPILHCSFIEWASKVGAGCANGIDSLTLFE